MTSMSAAAIVVALTASAVLLPAGAFADSATVKDSSKDTWESTFDYETHTHVFEKAGSVANVDVEKSTVKHTKKRVEIAVRFVALKKSGAQPTFYATLDVGNDTTWMLGAYTDENWEAQPFLSTHTPMRATTECEGLKAAADFADDVLVFSAPRSCIGNPEWVRYHGVSSGYESTGDSEHRSYLDNAHNKTHNDKGWTDKVKKS